MYSFEVDILIATQKYDKCYIVYIYMSHIDVLDWKVFHL